MNEAQDRIPKRLTALAVAALALLAWPAVDAHAVSATGSTTGPLVGAGTREAASCYRLFGNATANGTTVTPHTIGVAHRTLPFGTRLVLRSGNRVVLVQVIDRGPFVAGRSLDLTHGTVRALGYPSCEAWGHRTLRAWRLA